jgi:hypothetical protein
VDQIFSLSFELLEGMAKRTLPTRRRPQGHKNELPFSSSFLSLIPDFVVLVGYSVVATNSSIFKPTMKITPTYNYNLIQSNSRGEQHRIFDLERNMDELSKFIDFFMIMPAKNAGSSFEELRRA